jgi:hypothetical protein
MIKLIQNQRHFRWFDSGDFVDEDMVAKVMEVCKLTPNCKHWIATRETSMVKSWLGKGNAIPKNVVVRASADFINNQAVERIPEQECAALVVTSSEHVPVGVHCCPTQFARNSGKTCTAHGCRACWDQTVKTVAFKLH